ncbi:MAG: LysR substrate-binding domain-containing protein [Geminicoccaceae bacterium]
MSLTLKQLRYFSALAETLHFGRAAKLCHVTQPALSMQIRDLEANLGVVLVERGSSGLLLTDQGHEIARRAHDILVAVQDLSELAAHRHHPLAGRLRLGVIPSVGPYLLPKILPEIHQTYPELKFSLRESQTEHLIDDLVDGHLDLLILALPVLSEGIETLALFDDGFSVALPPDHNLAGRAEIHQDELGGEHLLLLEEGHCLREQALAVCQSVRTDEFRASSLATVIQMVANGYGVTILPALALPVEVGDESDIKVVPFAKPEPKRTIGLAWRRSSPHKPVFAEFGEFVQIRVGSILDLKLTSGA